jgi:hypothetical protein
VSSHALLFEGPAGMLGAAAVKVALAAGVNGNTALLFGRMSSFNGKPFWELRENLRKLFGVSKRTITRYFRTLVDAGLIVNKPAPLKVIHPGASRMLPFRPWYKWVVGLPELREAVKSGSRDAYDRWRKGFEASREQRVTRTKLASIIGSIVSRKAPENPRPLQSSDDARPRRWTAGEIDAELSSNDPSHAPRVHDTS